MSFWGFRDYLPVTQRRANAAKEVEKLKKQGCVVSPVVIEGRKIAGSFWGKAWCENLERYSDFASRLPRGRTYVNNGSVVDLQVTRGKVEARVSGSEIYKVKIDIAVATPARWKAICADCAGSVGSIVELLQGKVSKHVMERVCRQADGLFPAAKEIKMSCSCPDWADMCKHVAATLYGVGHRLDHDPDLVFTLRGVDRSELISTGADLSITEAAARSERVLANVDVAALFGLEFEVAPPAAAAAKDTTPTTKPAITDAEQVRSASVPMRAAKWRATKASSEREPQAAQKSGSKSSRVASATKANSGANARRAHVARSGRGTSIFEVYVKEAESAWTPKTARNTERTHSTSAEANRKAPSRRAAAKDDPAPVAEAKQKRPRVAEKLYEGRTRAAQWISSKGRKPVPK